MILERFFIGCYSNEERNQHIFVVEKIFYIRGAQIYSETRGGA